MPEPRSTATLLADLQAHAKAAFAQTAEMLSILAEVDRRDAWADKPYGSLFAFCLGELGWSEGETAKKIQACRAARSSPLLLERLGEGRLHLAGIVLLAPRLAADNHVELIDAACGKSKRDIERLLAARFPRPDVAPAIRKLPTRTSAPPAAAPRAGSPPTRPTETTHGAGTAPVAPAPEAGFTLQTPASRGTVEPLAAERHRLTVTIGDDTRERIARIQALLGHRTPEQRSLEAVLDAALELLEAKLLKDRFGVGAKARSAARATPAPETEMVAEAAPVATEPEAEAATTETETAATMVEPEGEAVASLPSARPEPRAFGRDARRAIIARDGLRCTYVDPESGVRCSETHRLTFDHVHPRALGGKTDADNGRILCAAHNRQQARLVFGDAHVREKIAAANEQTMPIQKGRNHA